MESMSMTPRAQAAVLERIANATVKVLRKGGLGVWVTGDVILTAAHCIDFRCDGSMALGDFFIEEVETIYGMVKTSPLAVEPVSDIALLGGLDDQVFPEESQRYNEMCTRMKPVSLYTGTISLFQKFPVSIRTHVHTWITGTAECFNESRSGIWIEVDQHIEGGTSGGPIVNDAGQLVGIVSTAVGPQSRQSSGLAPCPYFALPVWVVRQYFDVE